ncbi:MAG: hypothetical protein WC310_01590 [Patescibacteria group bacterium]|jgi:hypothetical protein
MAIPDWMAFSPKPPEKEHATIEPCPKPSQKTDRTPQEVNLESGEIFKQKELNGGCNEAYIIDIKGDGKGVFKPKKGEINLSRLVERGTYYKRERAAYLVNKFIDLGLVPSTIIRNIDNEIGSVQEFIPDAEAGHQAIHNTIGSSQWSKCKKQMLEMWLLDYLIWNGDRHGNNFLIDTNNSVVAIDNGLSFSPDSPIFYSFNLQFDVDEIPVAIKTLKKILAITPREIELLQGLLMELLSKKEVAAFIYRLEHLRQFFSGQESADDKKIAKQWNKLNLTYDDNSQGINANNQKPKFNL